MRLHVETGGLSDSRVRRSVLRILRGNVLCSMATVGARGRAHISTAYFCHSRDLELFFLSDPAALHCRNLVLNPSMAVAIFDSSQEWGGPDRGIQLFGTCRQARGRQAIQAERLYGKRFRAYARWRSGLRPGDRGRSYRFFRYSPSRLKVLDEAEFGDAALVVASVRR